MTVLIHPSRFSLAQNRSILTRPVRNASVSLFSHPSCVLWRLFAFLCRRFRFTHIRIDIHAVLRHHNMCISNILLSQLYGDQKRKILKYFVKKRHPDYIVFIDGYSRGGIHAIKQVSLSEKQERFEASIHNKQLAQAHMYLAIYVGLKFLYKTDKRSKQIRISQNPSLLP